VGINLPGLFGTCRTMAFATCGLWTPFAAARRRESPLPGPRNPFALDFGQRFAHRSGAETARRRCRPEQNYLMLPVPFDAPVPDWPPGGCGAGLTHSFVDANTTANRRSIARYRLSGPVLAAGVFTAMSSLVSMAVRSGAALSSQTVGK
jgi:hypothetical protein